MTDSTAVLEVEVDRLSNLITALSMTLGRGAAARAIADLARLTPEDEVVDIGCGPGTAVRVAARTAKAVTGVDPSPLMLQLARRITAIRRIPNATWVEAPAEALTLADASATVAWALSSVHHWDVRTAGIAELHRVLRPGGRLLLAERQVQPGARGHAAHGLTRQQAEDLAGDLTTAGFVDVGIDTPPGGRRPLVVVHGTRNPL